MPLCGHLSRKSISRRNDAAPGGDGFTNRADHRGRVRCRQELQGLQTARNSYTGSKNDAERQAEYIQASISPGSSMVSAGTIRRRCQLPPVLIRSKRSIRSTFLPAGSKIEAGATSIPHLAASRMAGNKALGFAGRPARSGFRSVFRNSGYKLNHIVRRLNPKNPNRLASKTSPHTDIVGTGSAGTGSGGSSTTTSALYVI